MIDVPCKKGYAPFKKYKVYYEIYGESGGLAPLLILHGGPGSAHNYMLPLAKLAESGRQVIFYDQLGCGLSDRPTDDSLWEVATFVDEIDVIRKHLGLDTIHLLGHSWGGMLAASYLVAQPKGVTSAILASAMVNMPLFRSEVEKLKMALPVDISEALFLNEAGGTFTQEYWDAYNTYEQEYILRGDKNINDSRYRTPKGAFSSEVYQKMWGISEAWPNGSLQDFDLTKQLGKVRVPSLVISGQFDEMTPAQSIALHAALPNAELCIMTGVSHSLHRAAPEEFCEIISQFLEGQEK